MAKSSSSKSSTSSKSTTSKPATSSQSALSNALAAINAYKAQSQAPATTSATKAPTTQSSTPASSSLQNVMDLVNAYKSQTPTTNVSTPTSYKAGFYYDPTYGASREYIPGFSKFNPAGMQYMGSSEKSAGQLAVGENYQPNTGNPLYDSFLQQIESSGAARTAIANLIGQYGTNVLLSPDIMQRFLEQAEREIKPYYGEVYNTAINDLKNNFAMLKRDYDLDMQSKEAEFKDTLGLQREKEAGAGTIFSGGRGQRELDLSNLFNRNLEQTLNSYLTKGYNLGSAAETKLGTQRTLTAPSNLGSFSATTEGAGGFTSTGYKPAYSQLGGVTGSIERQQLEDTEARKRSLESDYRGKMSSNYYQQYL